MLMISIRSRRNVLWQAVSVCGRVSNCVAGNQPASIVAFVSFNGRVANIAQATARSALGSLQRGVANRVTT